MLILQYQFTNIDDSDSSLMEDFGEFVIQRILETINTKINRKKISIRLKYMIEDAKWINWYGSKKYDTTVQDLMQAVADSFKVVPYKYNLWKIEIDPNVLIPNSSTSIDRFIRFLNYGDTKNKATGIFTKLENNFNHNKLKTLWQFYNFSQLGGLSTAEIIAK